MWIQKQTKIKLAQQQQKGRAHTRKKKTTKCFMCKNYAPFNKQCLSQYFIDIYRVDVVFCDIACPLFFSKSLSLTHTYLSRTCTQSYQMFHSEYAFWLIWKPNCQVCVYKQKLVSTDLKKRRKKENKNEIFTVCVCLLKSILHGYNQYAVLHCDTLLCFSYCYCWGFAFCRR